ncbi:hypothetical protein MRX96_011277 [Rhipicephalus microplus]
MPPIRCLLTVPHIQIKRTYHLEEGSVVALKHAIATCPVLGSQVQLSCSKFQVMDPLFNELVDLATEDSIPDMSKIVLMAQQESSGNEAPSCSSSQGTLQAVVETGEQDTPSMVIEPVERQDVEKIESEEKKKESQASRLDFPPPFPRKRWK